MCRAVSLPQQSNSFNSSSKEGCSRINLPLPYIHIRSLVKKVDKTQLCNAWRKIKSDGNRTRKVNVIYVNDKIPKKIELSSGGFYGAGADRVSRATAFCDVAPHRSETENKFFHQDKLLTLVILIERLIQLILCTFFNSKKKQLPHTVISRYACVKYSLVYGK